LFEDNQQLAPGPVDLAVSLEESACLTVELEGDAETMWVVDPESSGWEVEDYDPQLRRQRFRSLPGVTETSACIELGLGHVIVRIWENGDGPSPTHEWLVMIE
jgi:hypothetical protein